MPPEDIDDLFRNQLAGHETPPGDALWVRLNAASASEPTTEAAAERLDQLFKKNLKTHVTPPSRELWERLEDEHLRPHQPRATAWWPVALAAAVALLLVAGGAGHWLGFPSSTTKLGTVARQGNQQPKAAAGSKQNLPTMPAINGSVAAEAPPVSPTITDAPGAAYAVPNNQQPETRNQKPLFFVSQATRPAAFASTAPKAKVAAFGPLPRHPLGNSRQPDAAAEHPLVARTAAQTAIRPAAADEQRPDTALAIAVAPKPIPAAEIVPAVQMPAASLVSAGELITVDVRNGGNLASRPTKITTSTLAAANTPEERRGLGGRLLQQAGHLVRGERISLAEITGLPENLTLRATVAGRRVSKSIQL